MDKKTHESIMLKALCNSDDQNSEDELQGGDLPDELLSLGKLTLGPKKKLLVISIGGFLCHRVFKYMKNRVRVPLNRKPDADVGTFRIYKRPFSDDFVRFCFQRFDVGIWSSSKEYVLVLVLPFDRFSRFDSWVFLLVYRTMSNVDDALDCVMGELKKKLVFTWDQEECTETGFKCLDNKYKPIFLKDLNVLMKSLNANGSKYSADETLLIDSDPYKSLINPPNTSVSPDEYTVTNLSDNELGPEGKLRKYLDELSEAEDLSSFVKENPFGKPAITPSHPDWSFYSEIVDRHGRN